MLRQEVHTYSFGRGRRLAFPLVYILVLLLFLDVGSAIAQPTGYQEYYVLGYEEQVWRAFLAINDDPDLEEIQTGKICSTVSLVATADYQVVYYDHWEDGYESDLLNPVQSTTMIYGDGDTGNGGSESDFLRAGEDINLISDQDIAGTTAITGYVPVSPARNPADLRYDGGDRIISSGGPVDLVHAMWPLGNSWIGGAWEVYSRQAYANSHSYRLPIGEDLYEYDAGSYGDFRDVYLQLGAFEDNTTVLISNDTGVVNLTLNRGQTYSSMGYINSTSVPTITINAGTVIRSNNPVQVGLMTGSSGNFQGRFLVVLPDQLWGADYVVPVPSGDPGEEAEIYLSNPNDFPITVNAYDLGITQTAFSIPPTHQITATVPYSQMRGGSYVPAGSAARFTSSDGVFGVVVCASSTRIKYDWGFAGVPSKYLTQDYYVSWAPGDYNIPPQNNGSPVWVTPLADGTSFSVDFSPLDGVVDQTFTLDILQQRRIFDPDNDNTGMHIWATDEFAVAWGEDPRTADPTDPYLDLGVAILPLQQRWLDPTLTLDKTAEPTILAPDGGVVTFTLAAQAYNSPLTHVSLSDTLPISWTYVPHSTHVTYADGSLGTPEPEVGDRTLRWDLSADLDTGESLTLTFQAQITTTGSVGVPAYDDFESETYTHGMNWTGDWEEQGDDGLPGSGDVVITDTNPFAGSHHLHVQGGDNSISRALDLSGFSVPLLRFMRRLHSLEDSERFYLDIYDGVQWTTALTWTGESEQDVYLQEMVELSPVIPEAAAIRFRSDSSSVQEDDHFHIDQVEVSDAIATGVNRGEGLGKHKYSDVLFNPSDEAIVYLSPLNLVKSVSSAEAGIGDTLAYTLTYVNVSSSAVITDVTLHDVVPVQHVTFQSASEGYSYNSSGGTISWALGTLAPGASGYVTFTAMVNDFVEDGTVIENVGYIDSPQTMRASSNPACTGVIAPEVEFTKLGPTAAARGRVITYTLSYENFGGAPATGVTVQDVIPVSTTYVAGSLAINPGSGWIALTDEPGDDQGAYISPTLVITPSTIAAGGKGRIRYRVRIDSDLPPGSRILNSATLDRHLDIPRESNLMVTRISDLLIHKEVDSTVVAPGDSISYTLIYGNASATGAQTDVYVRERIPPHTTLIPGTVYGGDQVEYSWDNGATWVVTLPITPVTHIRWYDAQLPAGTQVAVGFATRTDVTVPPDTAIQNMAHISSTEAAAWFLEWIPSNQVEVVVGAPDFGIIYGMVFEDGDGDGERDANETGIPGVTITFDGELTTTTELNGNYTFSTIVPGMHTVIETDPAGDGAYTGPSVLESPRGVGGVRDVPSYTSTTPNEVHVYVVVGNYYRVDFGDMRTDYGFASIHGTVFEDSDGDGVRDIAEPGIPDVAVTLDGEFTTTTELNGNYTFSTTVSGVHIVREVDPDGYLSTTPNEVHVNAVMGNSYVVEFGDQVAGTRFALIYGTVFDDANSNREFDADEAGIPNVSITLDDDDVTTTGPHGGYTFSTTVAGSHTIVETDLDGYLSTTPNRVSLDVIPDSNYQVDFGDMWPAAQNCDADIYEEDDSLLQAVTFTVNTNQAHQFCDDAVDWVRFSAQANAVYTITTSSWGQRADTFLTLFDDSGQRMIAANDDSRDTADYSSRIVWSAPTGGVYYVRVTNRGGLTGYLTDYDLVIGGVDPVDIYLPVIVRGYAASSVTVGHGDVRSPMGVINHACPDGYETDDTWRQAHPIEFGVPQIHSFDSDPEHYVADKDFVSFDISDREIITVLIAQVTNTSTLMQLYDRDGNALSVTGTSQLKWMPSVNGRYYLSVSPADGVNTFGCADAVGYNLLMETLDAYIVYLPTVMRNSQ
jgi:uncharacterized repeat protein (TIGR01451 family)